mgnify:CR=1 FL=1
MVILSTSIEEVTTENHPVYEKNKMISKQSTDTRSSNRKKNTSKKNKSNMKEERILRIYITGFLLYFKGNIILFFC